MSGSTRVASRVYRLSAVVLLLATCTDGPTGPSGSRDAEGDPPPASVGPARVARVIEPAKLGVPHPAGLAYSPGPGWLLVAPRAPGAAAARATGIERITLAEVHAGTDRIGVVLGDPVNMTFDGYAQRLLILGAFGGMLTEIPVAPDGRLDPEAMTRIDTRGLRLGEARGMTVDPAAGRLFILDVTGPRIVAVDRDPSRGFEDPVPAEVRLTGTRPSELHGLAYDPRGGNLHVLQPNVMALHELTASGELVATRDLFGLGFRNPQGMTFGPIGDMTDDPAETSLYIADAGLEAGGGRMKGSAFAESGLITEVSFDRLEVRRTEARTAATEECSGCSTTEVRVAAGPDDAEEDATGDVDLDSSDLELIQEDTEQTVGMRFSGISIPYGATVEAAHIQFTADEAGSVATSLTIEGEATDDASPFADVDGNVSSRPRTSSSVSWSPPAWETSGDAGTDQRTPDLSPILQEIVTRPGWSSGNSLAIIVTGAGKRVAESYDGTPTEAPVLHVEYTEDGNAPPFVTVTSPADESTFDVGDSVAFTGTASDAEDGDLTAALVWTSDLDGQIGTGGSFSTSALSVGEHAIEASVTDSEGARRSVTITVTVFAEVPVLVGAGDIADCSDVEDDETGRLLDGIAGTVFTLGDNVYPDGTEAEFRDCYDPTWGRHRARTRPSPGNHDYHTPGASGYFGYFGEAAGEPGEGYYSYDVGSWHVVALNGECDHVGGCDLTSPQGQWLEADLAANESACVVAYWHDPRFSSSETAPDDDYRDFWLLLYDAGADVVLNGHDHYYERFAPQDPDGNADPGGIRQFTVGTGGKSTRGIPLPLHPNSEVADTLTFGVLKLTLETTSYSWEFIPVPGSSFTDSGSASCTVSSGSNDPPEASDDDFSSTPVDEGGTLTNLNVLANDSDPDGTLDASSVTITGATNGTATANADGTVDFTHDGSETTTASFTYTVDDDGGATSNEATATLAVSPVNDPPAATDDAYSVEKGGTLSVAAPGLLSNDTDAESDPLTVATTPVTAPADGTLTLNADGAFSYTHDGRQTTSDSFIYEVSDGNGGTDQATVALTITAASGTVHVVTPAGSDGYFTSGGRFNDRHLEVTVTLVDGTGAAVANASVSATISGPTPGDFSGTTDDLGEVTFKITNAAAGTYTTTVTDVTAAGLTWDGTTPENSFTKN